MSVAVTHKHTSYKKQTNDKQNFVEFLKKKLEERMLIYDYRTLKVLSTALTYKGTVRAIMLRGPPGVGKTSLAEAISDIFGARLLVYQCTLGTSEDDLLYKLSPSERTVSGIEVVKGILPLALEQSKQNLVVVLLDEFDKTRPSADALLLDFLQNARVTVRISNEEEVILGNKENLIVFLTSNDEREFSEPLMRRLVTINLSPLPTMIVYNLLLKKFDEKIATLLAQIYDDTVNAGLRKPATIQELYQLGEAISMLKNIDNDTFQMLLRSYVIKYDDDFNKYIEYIKSRTPYQWIESERSDDDEDIARYYRAEKGVVQIEQKNKVDEEERKEDILSKMPRVELKVPSFENIEKTDLQMDVIEDHGVIPSSIEYYDAVIKVLRPEPTDNPAFLSDAATFHRDYAVLRQLTLDDLREIASSSQLSEKFRTLLTDSQLFIAIDADYINHKDVVRIATTYNMTIAYYTKNLIRLKNDWIDMALIYKDDGTRIEIVTNSKDCYRCDEDLLKLVNVFIVEQATYKELELLAREVENKIGELYNKYNRGRRYINWMIDNKDFEKEFEEIISSIIERSAKVKKLLTPVKIHVGELSSDSYRNSTEKFLNEIVNNIVNKLAIKTNVNVYIDSYDVYIYLW